MARLADKAALITGGESGIGLATARLFVAEGGRVHLAGLRADLLAAAAAELGPDTVAWSVTDVTDEAQVSGAVQMAVDGSVAWTCCSATPGSLVRSRPLPSTRRRSSGMCSTSMSLVLSICSSTPGRTCARARA